MKIQINIGLYRIQLFAVGDGKVRITLIDQSSNVLAYTDEQGGDLTLAVKLVTGEK